MYLNDFLSSITNSTCSLIDFQYKILNYTRHLLNDSWHTANGYAMGGGCATGAGAVGGRLSG